MIESLQINDTLHILPLLQTGGVDFLKRLRVVVEGDFSA